MKFNDYLYTDQFGVKVNVGDVITELSWSVGSYYMYSAIAVGIISNSGNTRALSVGTHWKTKKAYTHVQWSPKGKGLKLPAQVDLKLSPEHNAWLVNYRTADNKEELFNDALRMLTRAQLRNFKLEITHV